MTSRQIMSAVQDELAKRDATLHYKVKDEVAVQLGEAIQTVVRDALQQAVNKIVADMADQLNRHVREIVARINSASNKGDQP